MEKLLAETKKTEKKSVLTPERRAQMEALLAKKAELAPKNALQQVGEAGGKAYETFKNAPGVKQFGQAVGAATGALGATVGATTGGIYGAIEGAATGKPILQTAGERALEGMKSTGSFGETIGKEAAPSFLLGGTGKLVQGGLAASQAVGGAGKIAAGDTAGGLTDIGLGLSGLYGAKGQKGLIVNQAVSKPAIAGLKAIGSGTAKAAGTVAGKAVEALPQSVQSAGSIVKQKAVGAVRAAKTVPERLNIAAEAGKADEAFLKAKPPEVQKAVSLGIKPMHAERIVKATKEEAGVFKKMADASKQMERGADVSSADIAGSELRKRLAEADSVLGSRGQELGEIAAKLPAGPSVGVQEKMLEALRKVPGLNKLDIVDGKLDFSKTTLGLKTLGKASRDRIAKTFDEITPDTGYDQLHRIRQQIFEDLGGRKKAKMQLTATDEKAFDAIRKGLADTIEAVSPEYRKANQAYAKIAEPMKGLRKLYGGLENSADDILDEKGGLLIRRLTSNLPSSANLKDAIGQIDDILEEIGQKKTVDLKKIQEFQNILDTVYELPKETSFAGQSALGASKGLAALASKVVDTVGEALGSSEVKKKAIDDLIESVLTR